VLNIFPTLVTKFVAEVRDEAETTDILKYYKKNHLPKSDRKIKLNEKFSKTPFSNKKYKKF
jgi:hypothetical protein